VLPKPDTYTLLRYQTANLDTSSRATANDTIVALTVQQESATARIPFSLILGLRYVSAIRGRALGTVSRSSWPAARRSSPIAPATQSHWSDHVHRPAARPSGGSRPKVDLRRARIAAVMRTLTRAFNTLGRRPTTRPLSLNGGICWCPAKREEPYAIPVFEAVAHCEQWRWRELLTVTA